MLPLVLVECKIGSSLRLLDVRDADLTRNSYLIYHKNRKFSALQQQILALSLEECRRQAEETAAIEPVRG